MQQPESKSPVDWSKNQWIDPAKLIKDVNDLERFKSGSTYHQYITFITRLQASVESKAISATPEDTKFKPFVELLDRLILLVDEVPPIQQKMRFGNTAFKDWHSKAMVVRLVFTSDL